ncbi:hypothetical protein QOT17_006583 [Balamuthia mandrillaris]
MAFAHSTHFQHWFFTPEALQTEKQETYERGIAHLGDSNSAAAAMTLEEEDLLKRHYQTTIQEACAKMGVPDKVMASAITYFKRYFLKHPITHHSLKHIMATCIYVAGKIEECVIPATDLAAHLKMEAKQILAQEIPLLEGLEFQFVVYHPHRPLHGFVLDLKERDDTPPNIDDIWIHARELIHRVLTTDVPFLYTPSQVALACLHQAAADKEVSLAKYIHERFSNNAGFKDLLETVKKIQAFMGKQSAPVDSEQVQSLHEKYAQCMLPALNPKSEAYVFLSFLSLSFTLVCASCLLVITTKTQLIATDLKEREKKTKKRKIRNGKRK